MSGQRSIDSKREEFRKYLESAGLMDTLTTILTKIFEKEERPTDVLQYITNQFTKCSPANVELNLTQKHLESARERITTLEAENAKLTEELENLRNAVAGYPKKD